MSIRIFIVVCALFITTSAWAGEPEKKYPRWEEQRTPYKVFRSRAALQSVLGAQISQQVPSYFNFKTHALVFIEQEWTKDAKLTIRDYNQDPYNQYLSLKIAVTAFVETKEGRIHFNIVRNPYLCQSGFAGADAAGLNACMSSAQQKAIEMKTSITLFALERRQTKRIKIIHKSAQPPPAARPRANQ